MAALAAVVTISGCELFTGTDRQPDTVVLSTEHISFDAVTDTRTIEAEVLDEDGAPMSGAAVGWTTTNPAVASVDRAGRVTAIANGQTTIVATAGRVSTEVIVHVEQVVTSLALVDGDGQQGEVGAPLPREVEVTLLDRLGSPVPRARVDFRVLEGGGSVGAGTVPAGPDGVAAGTWTLGESAGAPQRLAVELAANPSLSAEVTATAVAGPPHELLKGSGDDQVAERQAPLAEPVWITLLDRFGNPVEDVPVSWAVTEGTGSVAPPVSTTDTAGRASTTWTLGAELGHQSLVVSVGGIAGVAVFSATALTIPAAAEALHGDGQVAVVGEPLATSPTIRVLDASGLPASGIEVSFAVLTGGGLLDFGHPNGPQPAPIAVVTTAADGTAQPAAWILGTTAGENVMVAEVSGLPAVTFHATGLPGPAAQLSKVGGDTQAGGTAGVLPVPVTVRVTDTYGNPVFGVGVEFDPAPGSGTATPAAGTSGTDGMAVTTWTLGADPGTHEMVVRAGTLDPVTFTATTAGSGSAGSPGYDIVYEYTGTVKPHIRAVFEAAAERWSEVITGDLPDVTIVSGQSCFGVALPPMMVDDLHVVVSITPMDGVGGILGSAGPCLIRSTGALPAVGLINLDEHDVDDLYSQGRLEAVILHELGHVIGIGTLWGYKGLLQNPSLPSSPGVDTHFTGSAALAAFDAIGGSDYPDAKVPVENSEGGQGTRDVHWRQDVFHAELMTGFLSGGSQPLSRVTIASLTDLGYIVNEGAADGYALPAGAPPAAMAPGRGATSIEEVILTPTGTVGPAGDVAPIPPTR